MAGCGSEPPLRNATHTHRTMRIASIDVGTNTVLLLLAEIGPDGTLVPLLDEQRFPRLGKGVDETRRLSAEATTRVIDVLKEYRTLLDPRRPDRVILFGTSAVRDALNREEFIDRIARETGLTMEVLNGEDEAYWTYRGTLSGIPDVRRATVVDIGGGSTEIVTGTRDAIEQALTLQIGSVRLTERFLRSNPPTDPELEAAITETEDALTQVGSFSFAGSTLVGVAGTATSLAALALGMTTFGPVSGYRMPYPVVEHLFRTLRSMPTGMIRTLSGVMEGREDIITAGALILREVMAHLGFKEVVVSERGVRYGLVLREVEGPSLTKSPTSKQSS
jgi:exopolyphosphatase / guanosine-5'-triphosphate,3'-diphosphate pyrophosphatase